MANGRSRLLRRLVAPGMLGVLIGSALAGLLGPRRLPGELRIASGPINGRYRQFASRLAPALGRRTA